MGEQETRTERKEGGLSTADLVAGNEVADESTARDEGRMNATEDGGQTALLEGAESERFRTRWQEIQAGFVDEPQGAVREADGLVAELMQRLAETFSEERTRLESQWDGEGNVSTEELRVALQRYRSFFDRLLSA